MGCVQSRRLQGHQGGIPFRRRTTARRWSSGERTDGWILLAHEHKKARTIAVDRDTAEVLWTSEANQPGAYFFAYSYYECDDGTRLILMACKNGLHAMSLETGEDRWWCKVADDGGITALCRPAAGMDILPMSWQGLEASRPRRGDSETNGGRQARPGDFLEHRADRRRARVLRRHAMATGSPRGTPPSASSTGI